MLGLLYTEKTKTKGKMTKQGRIQDLVMGGGRNLARWSESTIIIVSYVYGMYDAGKLR